MASPPPPADGKAPSPNLGNKDMVLAMEMAEEVGANIPVAKFMDGLDTAAAYEVYTEEMKR